MTLSSSVLREVFDFEWDLTYTRVQKAWKDELGTPKNGIKPAVSRVVEATGVSRRHVDRILFGSSSRPPKVGRNEVLTPEDQLCLIDLVDFGKCYTDESFRVHLNRQTGSVASVTTIREYLTSTVGANYKTIDYSSADKWTRTNLIRLRHYEQIMEEVDRKRLRFYDQTGATKQDLLPKKRRSRKSESARQSSDTTPSNVTKHFSFFGLTSIRRDKPPLWTKCYSSSSQNGQGTNEHLDFMISAVENGILVRGDVVVLDNWSAHKSKAGRELRKLLRVKYGIAMIYLPAKFSHLNPIEHCWRTSKSYARRAYFEFPNLDTPILMKSGFKSITHEEILSYMMSDGYEVDEETVSEVQSFSNHEVRPSHLKRKRN